MMFNLPSSTLRTDFRPGTSHAEVERLVRPRQGSIGGRNQQFGPGHDDRRCSPIRCTWSGAAADESRTSTATCSSISC